MSSVSSRTSTSKSEKPEKITLTPIDDIDTLHRVIRSFISSHFPKSDSCLLILDIGLPDKQLTLDFTSDVVRSQIG